MSYNPPPSGYQPPSGYRPPAGYQGVPAYQPPPMPYAPEPSPQVPAWAWLFVLAAILGVIGAIMPWFQPTIGGRTIPGATVVHSWNDGRIGLLGPILMLAGGIRWFAGLIGRGQVAVARRGRYVANPLKSASVYALIVGAVTLALLAVAYGLVPENYKDWDQAKQFAHQAGLSLGRGPALGFWLVLAAGGIFLALGAYGWIAFRKQAETAAPFAATGYGAPSYPSRGYVGPGYPATGYGAPGYPASGAPASGFIPPAYSPPGVTQPAASTMMPVWSPPSASQPATGTSARVPDQPGPSGPQ
ncbi:MAG: hypothetical protein JO147_13445 [Actinobacteria bacterium]|nr:hypothetical protein [Actinomycetota bacterium]